MVATRAIGPLVLGAAALGACVTLRPVAPSEAQLTRAHQRWPDATDADLRRGQDLFGQRCTACHALPQPADEAPSAWPAEVEKMGDRAHFPADQRVLIAHYLQTVSEP